VLYDAGSVGVDDETMAPVVSGGSLAIIDDIGMCVDCSLHSGGH